MQPVAHPQIFDDEDFLYQVKWDGIRMLAYIDQGQVTLINKNIKDKTIQFPELTILADLFHKKGGILDGELVVLKDGKPHFPSILSRNFNRTPTQIRMLSQSQPVIYMIFDIIMLGEWDLRREPLVSRMTVLEDSMRWQEPFYQVESFDDGTRLFNAIKENELEGIVAKRRSSPYTSGKKHKDWFKIKYRKRGTFIIGGFTYNQQKINALLLGSFEQYHEPPGLYYVGRVGSGLKTAEWELLSTELPKFKTEESPFINLKANQLKGVVFIEPFLTAVIEYAEMTDNLAVRAPVIIGFSSLPPEECEF